MSLMDEKLIFPENEANGQGRRQNEIVGSKKVVVFILFTLMVAALFYINFEVRGTLHRTLGIYGSLMVMYMLFKMLLSFTYKHTESKPPDLKVSVVVPSYNEQPDAVLGTIRSIIAQDYPIHEIFFVDDGSKDISGYQAIQAFKEMIRSWGGPELIVHRLPQNKGKRHAQIWAFERAEGDVIITVDSDTTLLSDAVGELIRPFSDKRVMATTGHVNVRNRNHNLLTRLIDMRYDNAFRVERAAHSVTKNILVCSGPLSAYRREVIIDNIEHYGNQKFLGEIVQFGDDRCLTNYAIKRGRTLYQSTARCLTDAPTGMGQFIKQQARWNKSFFRESLIALKIGLKKPFVFLWVALELSLWILFSFSLILAVIFSSKAMLLVFLAYYLFYVAISAYVRNLFYILKNPFTFLLAPVYGIIHLVVLFPLRFYSLMTIKSNGWGTR